MLAQLMRVALEGLKQFTGTPSGRQGGNGINYVIAAVKPDRIRDYLQQHPDARDALGFYEECCQIPGYAEGCARLLRSIREYQRDFPGCVVVCCDFT